MSDAVQAGCMVMQSWVLGVCRLICTCGWRSERRTDRGVQSAVSHHLDTSRAARLAAASTDRAEG